MSTRIGAVIIFLAVAVGAVWGWPVFSGAGTPRLAVDRNEVDLGDRPFGQRVRASFTLTNSGNGALTVEGTPTVTALEGC